MTLRIEFLAAAATEVDAADDWFEERRAGLGLEFVAAVDEAARVVAEWPKTGPQVARSSEGTPVRRVRVGRFPYYLAYVERAQTLLVVAVAHERRRPRHWSDRVD